jgi:hypothetical protein
MSKPIPVTEETASRWLNENVKNNPIALSPHPAPEVGLIVTTHHDIRPQATNTKIGIQTPEIESHFI